MCSSRPSNRYQTRNQSNKREWSRRCKSQWLVLQIILEDFRRSWYLRTATPCDQITCRVCLVWLLGVVVRCHGVDWVVRQDSCVIQTNPKWRARCTRNLLTLISLQIISPLTRGKNFYHRRERVNIVNCYYHEGRVDFFVWIYHIPLCWRN